MEKNEAMNKEMKKSHEVKLGKDPKLVKYNTVYRKSIQVKTRNMCKIFRSKLPQSV